MYLLLFMLLNGNQPEQPWNLMVGRQSGQYVVWERHGFDSREACTEQLGLAVLTNPVEAYCEPGPRIA